MKQKVVTIIFRGIRRRAIDEPARLVTPHILARGRSVDRGISNDSILLARPVDSKMKRTYSNQGRSLSAAGHLHVLNLIIPGSQGWRSALMTVVSQPELLEKPKETPARSQSAARPAFVERLWALGSPMGA